MRLPLHTMRVTMRLARPGGSVGGLAGANAVGANAVGAPWRLAVR